MESSRVKSKPNGDTDNMGTEDAQIRKKTIVRNKIGKVCIFIIMLILDSRMGFG
jgi:hypothetical protein